MTLFKKGGGWVSTVIGILTILTSLAVGFNWINVGQQGTLNEQVPIILTGIVGVVAMFAGGFSWSAISTDLKTTLTGILTSLVAVLSGFGVFTPEQGTTYVSVIMSVVGVVISLMILFTKDPDVLNRK